MLSKKQQKIIIELINSAIRSPDLENYLKNAIHILHAEIGPLSAAGYVSVESEEKLILVSEAGKNFDHLIRNIYNFSLMVRKSIKKKNVIFIPADGGAADRELRISVVLIPLVSSEKNMGMIGLVFPIADLPRQKKDGGFYFLIGRIIGLASYFRELTAGGGPDGENSEKFASLGILSKGVAHEFNNILAVIKGYAELVRMKDFDRKAIESAIETIDRQAERGARLIESLNVFAGGKEPRLGYHSLNEIVEGVLEPLRAALQGEHVELRTEAGDVPRVLVDPDQIGEVLQIIILNARQAIQPRGSGLIDIRTEFAEDRAVLRVKDNGTGMTAGQVERAINPFFTTKGSLGGKPVEGKKSGTGLGLAIAYGIMQSHGGNLAISSSVEEGTEVRLLFTRTETGPGQDPKQGAREFVYFGDTRILIVDDEDAIRDFLSSAFDKAGYQVITAASGEEAVEICSFEEIDIVFLDFLMPGLRGDKVFDSIKKVSPGTDVVFITGANEIPNIQGLLQGGLATILKKPFRFDKILKITNELIYRRLERGR